MESSKPPVLAFFLRLAIGEPRYRPGGRTLLELLVVIAIIALMLGFILTAAHGVWLALDHLR